MQTDATITIYLQALGGKFLGPNAYNTDSIQLSLTLEGKTLPITYKLTDGVNDGAVGPYFSMEEQSSFLPILTPPPATESNLAVNYLTANQQTICGTVAVTLSQPTVLGTVSASIPRPQGDDLVLTQSIALNQLQADYRVIMIVPGLLLEEPKADDKPDLPNNIFVYVKMMCGCPITTGIPKSFWAQYDFLVSAEVTYKNGGSDHLGLTLMSDEMPSLFHAAVNDITNIKQVNFTARQKSTGNIGYLSVDCSS